MVNYGRLLFYIAVGFLMSTSVSVLAQEKEYTPQEGLDYFKAENYKKAEEVYKNLLIKYPKDSRYNYYMGVCEMENRSNLSGSIKKLNYARIKGISRDVYYYLGRAHQLSYNFEEAIGNYKKFIQYASKSDERIEEANAYMMQCNNGRKISSKIYDVRVINKSVVDRADLLQMYNPAKDVGHLYKNSDFFESGVSPNHVMFETERGNVIYFSMETSSEDTLSIFKMVKLLDGWGDSETVGEPVNSVYNDAYPFLESDGLSFYFASDRPGGMGGFDIYKAYYDNETHSFLDPINLGVPFNSPDDDFLFVSDEFNKVAWFASSRETSGNEVMVYTIQWDGSQVRNMAEDANQVKLAAMLPVEGALEGEGNDQSQFTFNDNRSERQVKALFNFEINDSINYTQYEHFISGEALSLFEIGFKLEQQRDSLASLMKTKRKAYSVENDEVERSKVVNEIIRLENQVYSLDDQIQEKYLYARQRELNEIMNKVDQGTYNPSRMVKAEKTEALSISGVFIPEKYSMFSSGEFDRHYAKNEKMYQQLFSSNDIKSLKNADSLYVWANILNLESSQLLAKSMQVEEDNTIKLNTLINRNRHADEPKEETKAATMIKESKELKILSTRLYHKSLDKKYPIYWLKLKDISSKLDADKVKPIEELTYQGNAYFREAKRAMASIGGLNLEAFEKAGAMKRAGIESQENALDLYCNLMTEGYEPDAEIKKTHKGVVQKSYSELQGADVHKEEKKVTVVAEVVPASEKENKVVQVDAKSSNNNAEYRVQIGVFRNRPNVDALAKIPTVSSIELEGRGLTKYFSGSFGSKEEAVKAIPSIVDAGFPGAFVVYFDQGKVASMPNE